MNILLIYPEFPETFWSFNYALSFVGKKSAFPPLGLLTVAPLLPEEWHKRLVDVNVDKLTDKDLLWADWPLSAAWQFSENQLKTSSLVVRRRI